MDSDETMESHFPHRQMKKPHRDFKKCKHMKSVFDSASLPLTKTPLGGWHRLLISSLETALLNKPSKEIKRENFLLV